MTDERLCAWEECGLPENHPHHRDRAFFEWHPFEAAPSTDEGEALGLTETKIHAEADRRYELPREGGTYTGNEVLRQRWAFFNGAKWGASEARAPLERDLEIARMYAAGVEGTLEQVRTENRAAEERIRELEAGAGSPHEDLGIKLTKWRCSCGEQFSTHHDLLSHQAIKARAENERLHLEIARMYAAGGE